MTFQVFHRSNARRSAASRGGVVIVAVLAVFAVTVILCGIWATAVVRNYRTQRLAEEHVQVRWLAEAGVRRAAARRLDDPEYNAETWRIAAGQLGGGEEGTVHIRIWPVAGAAGRVRITARASYPADRVRVRETKTVLFTLPTESST